MIVYIALLAACIIANEVFKECRKPCRAFHLQVRRMRTSPDGRAQYGLGLRVGYWPCLFAPYVSATLLRWRVDLWHGLPGYKTGDSCSLPV